MKNKYKKRMRAVLKYAERVEFGGAKAESMEEVMRRVKGRLDDACLTVDEVCVQGVIGKMTAARKKDRMCRAILRACIARGLAKKAENPFEPAFTTLKYDMPVYTRTREPRPWQLPGWKSAYMLKREYDKWLKLREERQKAEA